MFNATRPEPSELPSTGRLLRSTGIAVVVATILLATVVLPSEYAIDPTGVGQVLGLTEMGRVKRALAAEAEQDAAAEAVVATGDANAANLLAPEALSPAPAAVAVPATAGEPQETVLTLAPDEGTEVKLVMRKGGSARFVWSTDGGRVNYDTHGDGSGVDYHGYGKGTDSRVEGVLTAAMDGAHGWFWRNRTDQPVTITLRTSGDYTEIKRFD